MAKYQASITVNRIQEQEMNQYGDKVTKPYANDDLLQITINAPTLERLQTLVKSHVDLIEE